MVVTVIAGAIHPGRGCGSNSDSDSDSDSDSFAIAARTASPVS